MPDEDQPPFGRIQVDPVLCMWCKECLSEGRDGCFRDGCPWDEILVIDMARLSKLTTFEGRIVGERPSFDECEISQSLPCMPI